MRVVVRHAALLLVCVLSNLAFAQNAPSHDTKPKGKIIDPFARMPHPRDGMKLPDPRAAAEKAAEEHDANAPASPQPAPAPVAPSPPAPTDPAPSQITIEPAANSVSSGTYPEFRRSKTPFGVTTMRIKTSHAAAPSEPDDLSFHNGFTLEAGTGVGWIHVSDDNRSNTSSSGTAGLSAGIGGWITDRVALTARLAGSSIPTDKGLLVAAFLGPSMQIWVTDRTWLGAGLGLASYGRQSREMKDELSDGGFGADLRLGTCVYTGGKHAVTASVEVTPSTYDHKLVTSLGLLLGYQLL